MKNHIGSETRNQDGRAISSAIGIPCKISVTAAVNIWRTLNSMELIEVFMAPLSNFDNNGNTNVIGKKKNAPTANIAIHVNTFPAASKSRNKKIYNKNETHMAMQIRLNNDAGRKFSLNALKYPLTVYPAPNLILNTERYNAVTAGPTVTTGKQQIIVNRFNIINSNKNSRNRVTGESIDNNCMKSSPRMQSIIWYYGYMK